MKWDNDPIWHNEFVNFNKLIYTPLDLPEPPTIDIEKFNVWSTESRKLDLERENKLMAAKSGGRYIPASSTGKKILNYPWEPAHALDPSREDWNFEFDKWFPELVDYINLFPFRKLKSINFIKQKPGVEAFLHTDPDDWLGFRFYLQNNIKRDCLYFRKLKNNYATGKRYSTYEYDKTGTKYRNWEELCEETRLYVDQKNKEKYAWALTSAWAAHGIDPILENEERITCIILAVQDPNNPTAGYKTKETLDLLERSKQKFDKEQIWYDR